MSENLWLSDIFRGYRNGALAWKGLIGITGVIIFIFFFILHLSESTYSPNKHILSSYKFYITTCPGIINCYLILIRFIIPPLDVPISPGDLVLLSYSGNLFSFTGARYLLLVVKTPAPLLSSLFLKFLLLEFFCQDQLSYDQRRH